MKTNYHLYKQNNYRKKEKQEKSKEITKSQETRLASKEEEIPSILLKTENLRLISDDCFSFQVGRVKKQKGLRKGKVKQANK
jgi:hypothetical protein